MITLSVSRTDLRGQTRSLHDVPGLKFREVKNNEWGGSTGIVEWRPERGQEAATYHICFHMQVQSRHRTQTCSFTAITPQGQLLVRPTCV